MSFLLDTNICIFLQKRRFLDLNRRARTFAPGTLAISSLTLFELEYGAEKSRYGERNRRAISLLQRPFRILPFEDVDAARAAQVRAALARQGTPVGPYDLLIAGQALARGLTLVSNNMREFSRIEGLAVEDWTEAA